MKIFVVLGTKIDPQISSVVNIMRGKGANVYIFDHNEDRSVDLLVDKDGNYDLKYDGIRLPKDIVIWDRQKLRLGMSVAPHGQSQDEKRIADLRRKEWRSLYFTISRIYAGNVFNEVLPRTVMTKPFQQIFACQSGFKCPETIVSNSKASFLKFIDQEKNIILKSLSGEVVLPKEGEIDIPYGTSTMAVTREDIERADDSQFFLCPHLMQQHIEKDYELRVVIINDRILAFKIDSQIHEYYAIDWRRGNATLDFIPIQLPEEIEVRLLKFMRKIGLFSGSIDLIVDTTGEYWFLECNQDGQWYWLEKFCNGAVSKAFAEEFLSQLQDERHLKSA